MNFVDSWDLGNDSIDYQLKNMAMNACSNFQNVLY